MPPPAHPLMSSCDLLSLHPALLVQTMSFGERPAHRPEPARFCAGNAAEPRSRSAVSLTWASKDIQIPYGH
jgi:hypothetical protein